MARVQPGGIIIVGVVSELDPDRAHVARVGDRLYPFEVGKALGKMRHIVA